MKRTAKDFVDDLLGRGRNWMAVLSVARQVRKGIWYEDAKQIMKESGAMPKDEEKARAIRDKAIKEALSRDPGLLLRRARL